MSAILRWFHDGDVRYRAYFRTSDEAPSVRQLIIASSDGEAVDVVEGDRNLEDFSYPELLAYAKRLRLERQAHAETVAMDAAAD
ncbi:MAG TPA: hypothetical protein VHG09_13845 [Longimicrobiales bacterium]|nr:hypothetical protein [Longimicrobiales bacterium]